MICQLRGDQIVFGGLEKTDQLREAPLVGIAGGTVTVGCHPLRVLDPQVFVNLLLKLAVGMNLVRHDNFLDVGLSQIAFRFNRLWYRLLSPACYCACAGFLIATREVTCGPSFGVAYRGRASFPLPAGTLFLVSGIKIQKMPNANVATPARKRNAGLYPVRCTMKPVMPLESDAPKPVAVATTPRVKLNRPVPRVRSAITSTLTTPKIAAP